MKQNPNAILPDASSKPVHIDVEDIEEDEIIDVLIKRNNGLMSLSQKKDFVHTMQSFRYHLLSVATTYDVERGTNTWKAIASLCPEEKVCRKNNKELAELIFKVLIPLNLLRPTILEQIKNEQKQKVGTRSSTKIVVCPPFLIAGRNRHVINNRLGSWEHAEVQPAMKTNIKIDFSSQSEEFVETLKNFQVTTQLNL